MHVSDRYQRKGAVQLFACLLVHRGETLARCFELEWLRARPANELFDTAVEAIKAGLSVLPPDERADRATRIVEGCRQVAAASGGFSRLLGLGTGVSSDEESILDAIAAKLRAKA